MSVKRWMLLMMKMLVGGCVVLFYSHWATFCLLRGTRPTKELKVDCLELKHTFWAMLGKARGGFHLAQGRMTTGASALFFLGRRVRTEGLLTKDDPHHPVDVCSSLVGGFLVDELHDTRLVGRGWRVTGTRSAGFGLDLVQPRDPFFTGSFFNSYSYHAWVALQSNYRTWLATLSTVPTRGVLFVSRLFRPEITSRPTLALFVHWVRKTCLL